MRVPLPDWGCLYKVLRGTGELAVVRLAPADAIEQHPTAS